MLVQMYTDHQIPNPTVLLLILYYNRYGEMNFINPHMLRHACGFKLANEGHDTRSLQHYLGHKNIQHTVRYTELTSNRFDKFWKD